MRKILALLVYGLISFSCAPSVDETEPINGPKPEDFRNLFADELENQTQTFHMNAEDGTVTFTTAKGAELTIDGSCLRLNNLPVTGEVDITVVEIYDRGTMLATNKTTLGLHNDEKHLLNSGGEFFIQATQNGQALTLSCGMQLNVPTELTGGTDNDMLPFSGTVDELGNLTWQDGSANAQLVIGTMSPTNTAEAYRAVINNFGWFNCDRFTNLAAPSTLIYAYVPQGYYIYNSIVFIAPKNTPNALGSIYGKYPIGMECHLIFVSEDNGSYRYSIKQNLTLIQNHQVEFHANEMQTATADQLVTIINALP